NCLSITPIRAARRSGRRTWNDSSKTIPGSTSISDSAISTEATSSSANPTCPTTMMFRRGTSKNGSTLAICDETKQPQIKKSQAYSQGSYSYAVRISENVGQSSKQSEAYAR